MVVFSGCKGFVRIVERGPWCALVFQNITARAYRMPAALRLVNVYITYARYKVTHGFCIGLRAFLGRSVSTFPTLGHCGGGRFIRDISCGCAGDR